MLEDVYGFTAGQAGASFAAVIIAALIGGVTNIYQEKLYAKHVAKRGPEARLYASVSTSLLKCLLAAAETLALTTYLSQIRCLAVSSSQLAS